jgi:hypothetical protein
MVITAVKLLPVGLPASQGHMLTDASKMSAMLIFFSPLAPGELLGGTGCSLFSPTGMLLAQAGGKRFHL